jgi:pyruvate dehydrogenase E1 component beta subunit
MVEMREAIRQALYEEMRRDERVFLMGEDIGAFGGCFNVTKGLREEFGETRVLETPIAEGGFTGMAVGAAISGMRPVVEIMFSDFSAYAMDSIANQAAKQRFMTGGQVEVPLVVRMPGGGGTGAAAQHSQSLEAWFCHVPGLIVAAPSGARDAKGLLKTAIRSNNPVIFIEHKLAYRTLETVPAEEYLVPIGAADVKRSGKDVTIVSYSYTVQKCMQAAQMLEKEGIDAEVLDLRTLTPLDVESVLCSVKKTGRLLVTHEAVQKFGVGAEVAAAVAQSDVFFTLKSPIQRFCGQDVPLAFNADIEARSVPQVHTIYDQVKAMLNRGRKPIYKLP